jgi:hypothetical protein
MTRGPRSRVIGALVREPVEAHNRAWWRAFVSLVVRLRARSLPGGVVRGVLPRAPWRRASAWRSPLSRRTAQPRPHPASGGVPLCSRSGVAPRSEMLGVLEKSAAPMRRQRVATAGTPNGGKRPQPVSSHHPHGRRYVVLRINSRVETTRLGCVLCGTTNRHTLADVERFGSGRLAGGVKGDLVDPGFRLTQQILAAAF